MDTVSGWKQSGRKKLFQSVKNIVTNRNTIQKNHHLVIRMKEKRRFVKSKKKQTVKFFFFLDSVINESRKVIKPIRELKIYFRSKIKIQIA